MRRREFLGVVGGAAAWPTMARAQQGAMPVVGFLHPGSPETYANRLRGFHRGLQQAGFIEGENVSIVYRWAENQMDRLPVLAADLVRRRVAVIVTSPNTGIALVAKAETTSIPIVFLVNEDPVKLTLVASLARPGGNLTGVNFFNAELTAKRLEILRELIPAATRIAVVVNPASAATTVLQDVESAARSMGLQIQLVTASTSQEIDAAFTMFGRQRPDALFVVGDPLFNSRRLQFGLLAARHAIPAAYASRDYPEYGGLMSYGTNVTNAFRQVGVYAGRILKGAKPADMPVTQESNFEFVINAQTARVLGITVPPSLLARADEVIE